jgi:hypothetical protein
MRCFGDPLYVALCIEECGCEMRSFGLMIVCLSAAGNMAAILEVDDNMGQTFLQVRIGTVMT